MVRRNLFYPFLCACVVSVVGMSVPVSSAGEAGSPSDPALRSRIESAVRDLGHSDLDKRNQAIQELEQIGELAAEDLFKAARSQDAEVANRAKRVMKTLKLASPDIRSKVQALRAVSDKETWDKLWGEIVDAGEGGQRCLEQEMNTPFGEASLSVTQAPAQGKTGRALSLTVTIRNEGKKGFWLRKDWIGLHAVVSEKWSADKFSEGGFDQIQAMGMFQELAAGRKASTESEAGVPYAYLEPGQAHSQKMTVDAKCFDFVGRCRVQLGYKPSDFSRMPLQFMATMGAPPVVQDSMVWTNPLKIDLFGVSSWIPLLPEPNTPADGMALTLASKERSAKPGERIPIRLVLRNNGPGDVCIPTPAARFKPGFWYALLDEKGNVVQSGCLDGQEGIERKYREDRKLASGQEFQVEGEAAVAAPPGKYRLVCGFSALNVKPPTQTPQMRMQQMLGNAPAEEDKGIAWAGDVTTPPVEIEVR